MRLNDFLVEDPTSAPKFVQKELKAASNQYPSVMLGRSVYYGYFVLVFNQNKEVNVFYVEKNAGHVFKFSNQLEKEKPNFIVEKKVARHDKGAKDKNGEPLIYPRIYADGEHLLDLGFEIGAKIEITYNFPNKTITIRPLDIEEV